MIKKKKKSESSWNSSLPQEVSAFFWLIKSVFSYCGAIEVSIGEHLLGYLKESISLLMYYFFPLQHILGSLALKIQQQGYLFPEDTILHTPQCSDIFILTGLNRNNRTTETYNENKVWTQSLAYNGTEW